MRAPRLFNAILIDRQEIKVHQSPVDAMITEIGTRYSLIVFPEGGRSVSGEVGEFKSGLYYLAKKRPDIELVPVHIDNLNRVLPRGEFLPVPLLSCISFGPPLWLERGEADLLVVYHHPSITDRPQGRGFLQKTLTHDRLVPVARRQLHPPRAARGAEAAMPYLAYAPSLALSGLVRDHLQQHLPPVRLHKVLECDSADALLEYALKGLGVCWLPGSLVAHACRQGALAPCWDVRMEIPFEVRLVRLRRRLSETAEAVWRGTPSV